MARGPRYIPPGCLVETTTRTIHGRYLLRPGRDLNEIVYGVIARAAHRYDVEVCGFTFLSNHAHLLLVPADAQQLALFMGYVNGNIAREVRHLHHWGDGIWSRRYQSIVVSEEPEAQEGRMRYLLENGCKEGLVRRPQEWPGASSTEALLSGGAVRGVWFNRTAAYEPRRRGQRVGKYDHAEKLEFRLAPLPAWRELSPEEVREKAKQIAREIERETRSRLKETGRAPLGPRRICRQNPHAAPEHIDRSPAPRFHACDPAERKRLQLARREFLALYRAAAEDLREGELNARFPEGCFPARRPFVPVAPGSGFT